MSCAGSGWWDEVREVPQTSSGGWVSCSAPVRFARTAVRPVSASARRFSMATTTKRFSATKCVSEAAFPAPPAIPPPGASRNVRPTSYSSPHSLPGPFPALLLHLLHAAHSTPHAESNPISDRKGGQAHLERRIVDWVKHRAGKTPRGAVLALETRWEAPTPI